MKLTDYSETPSFLYRRAEDKSAGGGISRKGTGFVSLNEMDFSSDEEGTAVVAVWERSHGPHAEGPGVNYSRINTF